MKNTSHKRSRHLLLLATVLASFVFDQVTKLGVIHGFRLGESQAVLPGFFNLTFVTNRGAAFGAFSHSEPLLRVLMLGLLPLLGLLMAGYVFRKLPQQSLKLAVAVALIIGGALGNLVDRVRLGYVVDFLDLRAGHFAYPAFNVADMTITVGALILAAHLITTEASPSVAESA
jgi:signal peptidase II